jgi:DNA-binding transcriptional MerR regulator/predicted N-acetyltransferase YhbS
MIRIGDFSRLSRTPVSTLRYYDEIGLLKPVEVDHFTGYRSYTFDQLARLNRILALKELGFSLEEIARLLIEELPIQELHAMLLNRCVALREQVQENQERIEQVDAWLKQVEKENTMSTYTVRAARIETDLPEIVRILNPYEDQPVTVEEVRTKFQYKSSGRVQRRLVSVDEKDAVTGYAGCVHEADAPAGEFVAWVIVDPNLQGLGIGSALSDELLRELKTLGATRLTNDVFDDDPQSLAFAVRRGFTIDQHIFNFELDLGTFDETPFLADIAALESQGLRFCALADFPDTPETRRKLYDLNQHPLSFQGFEELVIKAPWFKREWQLLAVKDDEWVGMAPFSVSTNTRTAYNLHTGVLPAYQNRKIATSLKVLAARYARQNGADRIITDNNLRNAPILAINRKMGYRRQRGKYTLVCEL